ncbi:hypothetical protein [Acuticoccus mangrovi]|uniref:Uncharacterized protein n=1 Tax=Acuticoccus mangrovi TaxID=2796142 RepID=A0A934MGB1_9HYPH|nr:hypothetical protein [Acuticoccus mangrovi]MBJ3775765.1 hypothetical protein [Acuticoccus mangrovi]
MTRLPLRLLPALAVLAATLPAAAQDLGPCEAIIGTYLTSKGKPGEAVDPTSNRSLLTILPGGVVLMSDSAQAGGSDWQPFSDASGAWSCEPKDEGGAFSAVLLDFTFAPAGASEQRLAKLATTGTYDDGALTGETTLSFFPLHGDPTDDGAATDATSFSFTAKKVATPAP